MMKIRALLESSRIAIKEKESLKMSCTLGGLLVFSSFNSLWLPHNMIRIVNKVNKNKKEIMIIQGSIIEMVDKAKEEISHIIPKDYPISAILEAINNAVLYRDYLAYNKNIEVVIADKNISIFSPGSLINSNVNKRVIGKKEICGFMKS